MPTKDRYKRSKYCGVSGNYMGTGAIRWFASCNRRDASGHVNKRRLYRGPSEEAAARSYDGAIRRLETCESKRMTNFPVGKEKQALKCHAYMRSGPPRPRPRRPGSRGSWLPPVPPVPSVPPVPPPRPKLQPFCAACAYKFPAARECFCSRCGTKRSTVA